MAPLPVLSPVDQRILGSLLEKQVTVPASYPLTLNALRTACNQSSSRDPVVSYDDRLLEKTARELKDRGLVRIVWEARGRRTLKYHQVLGETLDLAEDERALLTVLLLRGPQTPGEMRTRSERLHAFVDRDAVEAVLRRMAGRAEALVVELERQPGQHDRRWMHLLGERAEVELRPRAGESSPEAQVTAPGGAAQRERVLQDGAAARDEQVRTTYSTVVQTYADELCGELAQMPFESWLLRHVAELAGSRPVVDAGCGPGHVTEFLARAGADATGIDLTAAMIAQARERFPEGHYTVGDLRRLMRPALADGWGAVLAWYSLIHLAPSELADAVAALARPLAPGGWLLLALHAGTDVRHLSEGFGHRVEIDLVLHAPDEVRAAVTAAGLVDVQWWLRGPVPTRGESTERFYLLARTAG